MAQGKTYLKWSCSVIGFQKEEEEDFITNDKKKEKNKIYI
jgi:hypothetical protein